jgi:hypothetical protein
MMPDYLVYLNIGRMSDEEFDALIASLLVDDEDEAE